MTGMRGGRRGTAVMAALALLLLAGALLASAATISTASARAAAHEWAALATEGAARRGLVQALAGWSVAHDSLAVGEWVELPGAAPAAGEGGPASPRTRVRLRPLGAGLFALVAEARLGEGPGELARRRLRLLVQRPAPADSTPGGPPPPPRPIARWSLADLY